MYQSHHHPQQLIHHQYRQESTCKTCQICIETENTITTKMNSYRPRGSLARILYERQIADSYLNKINKNEVRLKSYCKSVLKRLIKKQL